MTSGLANLTALHWKRGSDYHVESACGRFTIAKTYHGDVVRYTLWDRRATPARALCDHPTYELAKDAAEAWR